MNLLQNDDYFDRRLREFLDLRAEEVAAASSPPEALMQRVLARPRASSLALSRRTLVGFAGLVLLLIAAIVLAVVIAAGSSPHRLTANGPIAYVAGGRITIVDSAGGIRDIGAGAPSASDRPYCCSLAWSPDGQRLLVASESQVIVINHDGSGRVALTGPNDTLRGIPAWSPDGTRVALPLLHAGGTQVFVVDAGGGERQQVSSLVLYAGSPAWSPDGTRLAFGAASLPDGARSALYVVGADGSGMHEVAPVAAGWTADPWGPPSWSPDGRRIAFDAMESPTNGLNNGHFQLFAVGADGANLALLAPTDVLGFLPQWSSDGAHVAFARWLPDLDRVDLAVVAKDGSGLRTLVEAISADSISWSPDSTRVLVEQGYAGHCPLNRTQDCPTPQDNPYERVLSVPLDGSGSPAVVGTAVDGGLAWGGQP